MSQQHIIIWKITNKDSDCLRRSIAAFHYMNDDISHLVMALLKSRNLFPIYCPQGELYGNSGTHRTRGSINVLHLCDSSPSPTNLNNWDEPYRRFVPIYRRLSCWWGHGDAEVKQPHQRHRASQGLSLESEPRSPTALVRAHQKSNFIFSPG